MLKIERSVFLVAFAFVLLAGGLLQLVVLPMMPWHAGFGLMAGGDWVRFHQLAVELAAVVRQEGWGSWVLRVEGQAPASVAAALYVITGIERPWVLLPLHGLLYATTAATLYSIANSLTVKRRFSLILLLPLFVFPSSAMIWGRFTRTSIP